MKKINLPIFIYTELLDDSFTSRGESVDSDSIISGLTENIRDEQSIIAIGVLEGLPKTKLKPPSGGTYFERLPHTYSSEEIGKLKENIAEILMGHITLEQLVNEIIYRFTFKDLPEDKTVISQVFLETNYSTLTKKTAIIQKIFGDNISKKIEDCSNFRNKIAHHPIYFDINEKIFFLRNIKKEIRLDNNFWDSAEESYLIAFNSLEKIRSKL